VTSSVAAFEAATRATSVCMIKLWLKTRKKEKLWK